MVVFRLASAITIVSLTTVGFSQSVTKEEVVRADRVLADYARNEAGAGRYCVTLTTKRTRVSFKDPEKSGDETKWFNVASDPKVSSTRYDDFNLFPGMDKLPVPQISSVFIVKSQVISRVNRRVAETFDSEADNAAEARFSSMCTRIDPWELPYADAGVFREENRLIATRTNCKELINTHNLTKFEENNLSIVMEFLIDKKLKLYKRIIYDKQSYLLPVECRLYFRTEQGKDLFLSVCRTAWGQTLLNQQPVRLPATVTFSSVVGNPEKPSESKTFELELFWVLGDGFSKHVFDHEGVNFVPPLDLREAIMENPTKTSPLKSQFASQSEQK